MSLVNRSDRGESLWFYSSLQEFLAEEKGELPSLGTTTRRDLLMKLTVTLQLRAQCRRNFTERMARAADGHQEGEASKWVFYDCASQQGSGAPWGSVSRFQGICQARPVLPAIPLSVV